MINVFHLPFNSHTRSNNPLYFHTRRPTFLSTFDAHFFVCQLPTICKTCMCAIKNVIKKMSHCLSNRYIPNDHKKINSFFIHKSCFPFQKSLFTRHARNNSLINIQTHYSFSLLSYVITVFPLAKSLFTRHDHKNFDHHIRLINIFIYSYKWHHNFSLSTSQFPSKHIHCKQKKSINNFT